MNDLDEAAYREKYSSISHELQLFMDAVDGFLGRHPELNAPGHPVIHSTKKRIKEFSHLIEKIERKNDGGRGITPDNVFEHINDLSGVRILLLFQADFSEVDRIMRSKVASGDWHLAERPKAYTWDPESAEFFQSFDLEVQTKSTSYTSVHYLVRPRADSKLCCEVQVRTLFEEIWGEVDHRINYPIPTDVMACKEQIRVLSKIVGAGSRLVDSIQRTITADNA